MEASDSSGFRLSFKGRKSYFLETITLGLVTGKFIKTDWEFICGGEGTAD